MIFTAIVMLVLALMGMILFDTKILFGILMILCAGGLLANELVLQKKITKKPIRVLIIGGLVAVFGICAILPGSRMTARSADDNTPSTIEGDTFSEEDEAHLKASREFYDKKDYYMAEMELINLSENAKKTETYYILSSDIRMGNENFNITNDWRYLNFLLDAVRDCPNSLILNYRAGITAYAMNRFITAENYLVRAFELAPADDPYTPYALAAVYKELDEDEYAYALMSIAEKNGMLATGECDGEKLVDWYKDFKKQYGETGVTK